MSQLTTIDATFLNVESPTTTAHIAGLGVLDPVSCPGGRLTVESVVELIRERAHLARPLRQRLVEVPFGIDRPYWIDDPDFDPAQHVHEVALPEPGDERRLSAMVAMLHERPLDRDRPLWEMFLIQGLSGGRAAVYVKVHHAAIDGVLAAETLAALLDLSPEPRDLPPCDNEPLRAPGTLSMLGMGLARAATHPLRTARSIARTAPYLDEVPGIGGLPGVGLVADALKGITGQGEVPPVPRLAAPATPFNGPVGRSRTVAFGSLPLEDVKRVRRVLGGSINDIVMALCASALRAWLEKQGELPAEPLVAAVPVSLRRGADADTRDAGNRISVMVAPLATHIEDPRERLEHVRAGLQVAKRRFLATSGAWLEEMTALVPAPLAGLAAAALQAAPGRLLRPVNLIVSNVPGPQFPLYLAGARVLAYHPVSVISDVTGGINITMFSYDGQLDVGVIASPRMVPDVWAVVHLLGQALEELKLVADAEEEAALLHG
jgi:WS/DGAT/MGAT family acyltransferase